MPATFWDIAKDVIREVQEQLDYEKKLNTVTNANLKKYIGCILKAVLKVDSICSDKIEEVMFLSESGSDLEKKTSSSESDASVHNSVEKEKNEEEKANKEESNGTEEEFNPEKDIMLFIDDNDVIMFDDVKDVHRLQIFDKVNKMKNFPGYQQKGWNH